MAKKFSSHLQVECWKEHTCVCCGSVFRYRLKKRSQAVGLHGCLLVLFLLLLVLFAAGIAVTGRPSASDIPAVVLGLCGLPVLMHVTLAWHNPHKNLEANRQQAQEEIKAQTLKLVRAGQLGQQSPQALPHRLNLGEKLAILLLFVGLGAMAAPEVVPLASGWPFALCWVAGGVTVLLGELALAWSASRRKGEALPTRVLPFDEEESPGAEAAV
jgi:hypothetical protein